MKVYDVVLEEAVAAFPADVFRLVSDIFMGSHREEMRKARALEMTPQHGAEHLCVGNIIDVLAHALGRPRATLAITEVEPNRRIEARILRGDVTGRVTLSIRPAFEGSIVRVHFVAHPGNVRTERFGAERLVERAYRHMMARFFRKLRSMLLLERHVADGETLSAANHA